MTVPIEKTADLYIPRQPTALSEKGLTKAKVPRAGFWVVQPHNVIENSPARLVGHESRSGMSYSGFNEALEAYNRGRQINLVQLHHLVDVPHASDGSTSLAEDERQVYLPLVIIKRPVRPDVDINKLKTVATDMLDGTSMPSYEVHRSPVTVGFLESVKKVGPHIELTIVEADVEWDDVPHSDQRTNYRFEPRLNNPQAGNLIRKKIWLESPLNEVYAVQGDMLALRARFSQESVHGAPKSLLEKVKLYLKTGRSEHRESQSNELRVLIKPMDPLVEVNFELRDKLEELKRGLLAQILLARQESRRKRQTSSLSDKEMRQLIDSVANEYLDILDMRKLSNYSDELMVFHRQRKFDGQVAHAYSTVIQELTNAIPTQSRHYQRTAIMRELEKLRRLRDVRISTDEVINARLQTKIDQIVSSDDEGLAREGEQPIMSPVENPQSEQKFQKQ